MPYYNIDEDPYYKYILNGGNASSSDSWESSSGAYSSQVGRGNLNFANHSSPYGATPAPASTEDDDEFGELEIPAEGFGEPQTIEEMQRPRQKAKTTSQEDGHIFPSTETDTTSAVQQLQKDLNAARTENANLRSQVSATPKPWPTNYQELPLIDPIRLEIEGMLNQARKHFDTLDGNANYYKNELDQALAANTNLRGQLDDLNSAPNPLQGQYNQTLDTNRRLQGTIDHMNSALNQLQGQLSEAVAANRRFQGTIDFLNSVLNPLQADLNQVIAANRGLQSEIDSLKAAHNPLQTQLNAAVATNGRLQGEINSLNSAATNPLAGDLKSKNDEIEDLRQQTKTLTGSESHFKSRAEEIELKLSQAIIHIDEMKLAAENDNIAANNNLKAKQKILDATERKLRAATRKLEVHKPLAEKEFKLEEELREARAENKQLTREKFNLIKEADERIKLLCDANFNLRLELGAPGRKVQVAHAQVAAAKFERDALEILTAVEKEEKEETKEEITVDPVPGAGTENPANIDPSIPTPADLLAAASASVKNSIGPKVAFSKEATLHVKLTAGFFWHKVKHTVFWCTMLSMLLLWLVSKDIVHDEPLVFDNLVEDLLEEGSTWYSPHFVVPSFVLVVVCLTALYQHVIERKAEAERLAVKKAERELSTFLQTHSLAEKQAAREAKKKEQQRIMERRARQQSQSTVTFTPHHNNNYYYLRARY
ncbi:hypothetical protein ONS95_007424 [Cadophora gregata]|uniref:uncharacterized protein n=1 Tax=Cadophora gregata TaxID=51156 RepID=UPI0026DB7D71|nr:uncharacterized protein ONS95_007424 [Cadophora gregata]KAK0118534.1 hypothetical protein ONS96_011630 [Cadophora gregata f. sp. sojae]KAK0125792.1 hypothetical protein ONS95_007424 [Cadophora gregata]